MPRGASSFTFVLCSEPGLRASADRSQHAEALTAQSPWGPQGPWEPLRTSAHKPATDKLALRAADILLGNEKVPSTSDIMERDIGVLLVLPTEGAEFTRTMVLRLVFITPTVVDSSSVTSPFDLRDTVELGVLGDASKEGNEPALLALFGLYDDPAGVAKSSRPSKPGFFNARGSGLREHKRVLLEERELDAFSTGEILAGPGTPCAETAAI
eukprot:TRINITY_DN30578_c0_g2_i1.p1 TRINITY_DN30578_c0_g2~~TRINITY_DN30578_c0_g2_i1.p1  ORF type:complete len:212 (+),score=19.48 TRINITY_DN30578_c0_g2_i1:18-653(+)